MGFQGSSEVRERLEAESIVAGLACYKLPNVEFFLFSHLHIAISVIAANSRAANCIQHLKYDNPFSFQHANLHRL